MRIVCTSVVPGIVVSVSSFIALVRYMWLAQECDKESNPSFVLCTTLNAETSELGLSYIVLESLGRGTCFRR